ncbi:probable pectinesterase/pectinesterase inhibitor 7 [Ipomoea triloba]|uniref:probable pectinesterase/pectinesterase inhibitor 7 n=1 Tax=Ipomoea triloba TaxID=35885 RepID=UPI00125E1737|nr:probable pectinesterase/pectinesterase inhibitor 7 [Ipomoea triloba]
MATGHSFFNISLNFNLLSSTMAIFLTHFSPSIFQRFLLIILLALYGASSLSFSQTISSSDAICDMTPHPEFCKSLFPRNNSTNINDLGRISLRLALSNARKSLNRLNSYFKSKNSSIRTTLYVLRDCRFLLGLNTRFLSDVLRSIESANRVPESAAGDAQSLLSAVMSNQQTCWDQLVTTPSASNISIQFSPSLSNGSLLYSVSLALFKLGWIAGDAVPREVIGGDRAVFGEEYVKVREAVVVNPDGTGNYRTVGAAVAAAPRNGEGGGGYYVIRVAAGIYEEYVEIGSSKKYVMMIGEGINKTIITGNRSVVDGWTTFGCATFGVSGQGFVAINMTFRNTAGPIKHQAVAVRNNADFSTFYKCSFEAYQDTLFTHSLRQFYRECDVYGTVDFIFGNAAAVLQNCNIYPRLPMPGQFNAVTAQGRTDINQNTGASFHNCTVASAADLAAAGNRSTRTFLGRPWKERSRTVFMQTFLGGLIEPAGWSLWIGDFALTTLFYAEYENTGPGSNTTERVTWPGYHRTINRTDAIEYTVSNFIAGDRWIPATGVPYAAGLL